MRRLLAVLSLPLAGLVFAAHLTPGPRLNGPDASGARSLVPPVRAVAPDDTARYTSAWKRAEAFAREGQPRSERAVVDSIYREAAQRGDALVRTRATLVLARLTVATVPEDSAADKVFDALRAEVQTATPLTRPLLHAYLAGTYQLYFQEHRWQIAGRTETMGSDAGRVATWTLRDLADAAVREHRAALATLGPYASTPVEAIAYLLDAKDAAPNGRALRPTLLDLVGHRALDFFADGELTSAFPEERFRLDEEAWFAMPEAFAGAALVAEDDSTFEGEATRLFQRLTRAHLTGEAAPLVDVTLRRLAFARDHSTLPDRAARTEAALRALLERYRATPHASLVAFRLAEGLAQGEAPTPPRPRLRVQAVGSGEVLPPEQRARMREALQICADAIRQYPSTPGADGCRGLIAGLKQPRASVTVEAEAVPGAPMRALVDYANVETLTLRVVPVARDFPRRLDATRSPEERLRVLRELLNTPPAETARFTLPGGLDVGGHRTEVPLAPRAVGFYALVASTDGTFKVDVSTVYNFPYAFLTVTNLAAVQRGTGDGTLELHVLDRATGTPVPGATARLLADPRNGIDLGGERTVSTATTDAEGHARLRPPQRYGYRLEVAKGPDVLDLGGTYVQADGRPDRGTQVVFFTDRALYRPGQTVYLKGIALTSDGQRGQVLASERVRVTFRDANGQEIGTDLYTTNEFGSFTGAFVAPQGRLGGTMQLVARVGSRDVGYASVQVEEYRRPRFEVTFDDLDGQPRFGEAVTVEGTATSYAGVPLGDATVQYRVVRQQLWPSWGWLLIRDPVTFTRLPEEEIDNGVVRADGDGRFRVTFTPRPDPGADSTSGVAYRYRILADVTDVSGETQSGETSVNVGFAALRAAVLLPPVLDLSARPDTLALVTENLSGTFTPAAGRVRFDLLRAPERVLRERRWAAPDTQYLSRPDFIRRFPHDPYGDEADVTTWPVARTVADLPFNTAERRSLALPATAARWPEGTYRVTVTSRDERGNPVESVQTLVVTNATTSVMPVQELVWAVPLTQSAKPGETARFLVGSAERGVRVRLDVEVDGEIVRSEWRTLDAEKERIEVPVTEAMRGGFGVHFAAVRASRAFTMSFPVAVPTGRDLALSLSTFRDKIRPGAEETWTISVAGADGERVAAEVVTAMYDASLDAILPHSWNFNPFYGRGLRRAWQASGGFGIAALGLNFPAPDGGSVNIVYDDLDRFGFDSFGGGYGARMYRRQAMPGQVAEMAMSMNEAPVPSAPPPPPPAAPQSAATGAAQDASLDKADREEAAREQLGQVQARRNLNETAFFFPQLRTDAEGRVSFTFTVPEALTRWNVFAFAHTPDLRFGQTRGQSVTQKDLMVTPNLPRFVREGDRLRLTARVDNRAGRALTGDAALLLFDAATMAPLDTLLGNADNVRRFALAADSSVALAWTITVPNDAAGEGSGAYVARIVARTADFSDGEETLLPVLTNRVLVTETLPLPIRGGQTRTYTLDKLLASAADPSLQHRSLTLEFTPNPAWYAVAALPTLMEYPYECTEQVYSRFYANALAAHIANADPRIRQVFEQWRRADAAVLRSNLERNEELKALLLEQTPWVQEAQDETERRRRIGLLFDLARVGAELDRTLAQLEERQLGNGAWPWFPGLPEDRYTTQLIVAGLGRLGHLGVLTAGQKARTDRLVAAAVRYLDAQTVRDLEALRRSRTDLSKVVPSDLTVHYLYGRAFTQLPPSDGSAEALDYFRTRATASWPQYRLYTQTLLALALHRTRTGADVPQRILRSARESARRSDELGMYWAEERGWFWYQAPIERQALLIEAFLEVANDAATAEEARIWLLKQKQVQDWRTTRATADAIYALLLGTPGQGSRTIELLAEVPAVTVTVGREVYDARRTAAVQEAGTGYFKQTWTAEAVRPEMGRVQVTNPGRSIAWGALYWQFFQPIERVTASAETPLRLQQALFVEHRSARGPVLEPLGQGAALRVGDKLVARLTLRVDRAMEYVHLQSLRASGLEPTEQLSGYRYQDGLGYYQTTRDASTDFFFGWLPTGTYVFEYGLRVRHAGSFAGALSRIQSMYAPEFAAHSQGVRIEVAE